MTAHQHPPSAFREFLSSESAGGIVLMGAAALALIIANSPLAPSYFSALSFYIGPLNLAHWINDLLMAVFFLLVGLEIKREFLDGQLSTWPRRILPGIAAAGDATQAHRAWLLDYVGRNVQPARFSAA